MHGIWHIILTVQDNCRKETREPSCLYTLCVCGPASSGIPCTYMVSCSVEFDNAMQIHSAELAQRCALAVLKHCHSHLGQIHSLSNQFCNVYMCIFRCM